MLHIDVTMCTYAIDSISDFVLSVSFCLAEIQIRTPLLEFIQDERGLWDGQEFFLSCGMIFSPLHIAAGDHTWRPAFEMESQVMWPGRVVLC